MVPLGPLQEITFVEQVSSDEELSVCLNLSGVGWQSEPFRDKGFIPLKALALDLFSLIFLGFACYFLKMLNGAIIVVISLKHCEDQ